VMVRVPMQSATITHTSKFFTHYIIGIDLYIRDACRSDA
jgi:hypothetical protein